MSVPVPDELKAYVKNINYDVASSSILVTVSTKLMFSTLISQQRQDIHVLSTTKTGDKIYVYVTTPVQVGEPFEGVESRLVISQAKLEKLILEQLPTMKIYYHQEGDDLQLVFSIPVNQVNQNANVKNTGQVGW